jgi:hypothetical protein
VSPMPDISVIICTRNRAASLAITLECLASADRNGIRAEVVVVDNAGQDNTRDIADFFRGRIPVRYVYEPTLGVFGKSHALNRALNEGGLGDIVAVLDDDMSPRLDWFQGVAAISARWPGKDLFTGNTYIVWPSGKVPDWAKTRKIGGWLYADWHRGDSDAELPDGEWFLGGHFWFRHKVLETGIRFKDTWLTEPHFQLDLGDMGFSGVTGTDAVAGHRIQPELLQQDVVLNRARRTGASMASVRLDPYRPKVKQARLMHERPWLGRAFCLLNHLQWRARYLTAGLNPFHAQAFGHRIYALERMTAYRELIRTANRLEAYSLRKRVRQRVAPSRSVPTAAIRSI